MLDDKSTSPSEAPGKPPGWLIARSAHTRNALIRRARSCPPLTRTDLALALDAMASIALLDYEDGQ